MGCLVVLVISLKGDEDKIDVVKIQQLFAVYFFTLMPKDFCLLLSYSLYVYYVKPSKNKQ